MNLNGSSLGCELVVRLLFEPLLRFMFHVKRWKKGFTVEERFFWRIATLALRLGGKVLFGVGF